MTMYTVMSAIPTEDIVTIANYITGDIIVTDTVENIMNRDKFHKEYKKMRVYKMKVGKVFGDLIIEALAE